MRIALIAFTAMALGAGDADARRSQHRSGHHVSHHKRARHVVQRKPPPFSYIVLNDHDGQVLAAEQPDAPRYPASLTKVMTLYLLFEQLQSGKLKLDSSLHVSRHASSRPPSKLGLKPGATIRVDQAIKAIVTRSANDVAAAIGEALGGSEAAFAQQMTQTAHALGMSHTVYRNASGLPDPQQVTTARDQALLGRAIQERFPHYFKYFATTRFEYRGQIIPNHNHLVGSVAGVDGIKTGYTNASGYNLLSSVHRDKHSLVAVVLGGRSWRTRDAFMRHLIEQHIAAAGPAPTAVATAGGKPIPAGEVQLPPARPSPAAEQVGLIAPANAVNAAEATAPTALEVAIGTIYGGTAARAATIESSTVALPQAAVATRPAEVPPAVAPSARLMRVSQAAAASAPQRAAAPRDRAGVSAPVVESSALPAWLTVLLVAFTGIAGSFVSGSLQMLRRCVPRRTAA